MANDRLVSPKIGSLSDPFKFGQVAHDRAVFLKPVFNRSPPRAIPPAADNNPWMHVGPHPFPVVQPGFWKRDGWLASRRRRGQWDPRSGVGEASFGRRQRRSATGTAGLTLERGARAIDGASELAARRSWRRVTAAGPPLGLTFARVNRSLLICVHHTPLPRRCQTRSENKHDNGQKGDSE